MSHLPLTSFAPCLAVAAGKGALDFGEILWRAFSTSDVVGKGIVLILLVFSMWAWSIIASKAIAMYGTRRSCDRFLKMYDRIKSPIGMGLYLAELQGPLKNVCGAGIRQLFDVCGVAEQRRNAILQQGILPRRLSQEEIDKIRSTMNRQVNVETLELESDLGMLSICVTISPFLGLLGTVWGVMATFMEIALLGQVELGAIAPGISGALLTTVVGLIVAIPSVMANILINSRINKTCLQMDIFLEDFIASLKLEGAEEQTGGKQQP